MSKSLLDYAFDFVNQSKEPVSFKDLWAYVVKESQIDDELAARKVSSFFTNLLLDGRFVTLGENTWDLRSRHPFKEVHHDMKAFYAAEEADDANDEMDEDEIAYNKVFEEPKDEDADDAEEEEGSEESEESESEEPREDK